MQPDQKKLDQWLDSALRQYGAADARPGLERRIAARLAAEEGKADRRRWWVLAGAVASVVVVVGIWLGRSTEDRTANEASGTRASILRDHQEGPDHDAIASSPAVSKPKVGARRRRLEGSNPVVEASVLPRREVFPSREPSSQYKLLVDYMKQTPRDEVASVIARRKDVDDLRVEDLEIVPLGSETTLESDQPN